MCKWVKNYFCQTKNEMSLQTFISDALLQVCNGIKDAQVKMRETPILEEEEKFFRAQICPTPINSNTVPSPRDNLYLIEFEVIITIKRESTKSEGGTIFVVGEPLVSLNYSNTKAVEQTNAAVNRIKFSVPVIYPSDPKTHF